MITIFYQTITEEKVQHDSPDFEKRQLMDTPMSAFTKKIIYDLANTCTPSEEITEICFSNTMEIFPSKNFNRVMFIEKSKEAFGEGFINNLKMVYPLATNLHSRREYQN